MPVVILKALTCRKTSEVLLIMPNTYTEIYFAPNVKERGYHHNSAKPLQSKSTVSLKREIQNKD